MTSVELRERFLAFFEAKGHPRVPSDSLIPSGDPTVLFTSAGMNQFKDAFLGKRTDLKRAASSQKCLRTGDLENVGKTPSHHSFFEMLGNFSFGDYFKAEAIQWGWEFLTGTLDYEGRRPSDAKDRCLNLPAAKLWVSIYEEDEDAFELWRKLGVPAERIKRFGQKENFWPSNAPKEGPNGPCGPCSEIYFDIDGKVNGPKSLEVWNLVFTQFDRQPDGSLKPLPRKNIDTGMGLERLTRVMQGVETDYETDLFAPIIKAINKYAAKPVLRTKKGRFAVHAIADHIRAIVFLIAEGLLPSNEKQGYVLRMLIRRASRFGRVILETEPSQVLLTHKTHLTNVLTKDRSFLSLLIEPVEKAMKDSPHTRELAIKREVIKSAIEKDEMQFLETLQVGSSRLDELIQAAKNTKLISGKDAFKLYDTYGFPIELTIDIAQERGFTVDRDGFEVALKAQQQRSRAGSKFGKSIFKTATIDSSFEIEKVNIDKEIDMNVTMSTSVDYAISPIGGFERPAVPSKFIGYDVLQMTGSAVEVSEVEAKVLGIQKQNTWVVQAQSGDEIWLVLDRSPFYGESGGQVSDRGVIQALHGRLDVNDVQWNDDLLMHRAVVREGIVKVQEPVKAKVDPERRLQIARSHTAAHMLHWALRKTLGPDAVQAGSYVDAERVRFDFSALKSLDEEQRYGVQALVNSRIRLADEIQADQMPIEQARQAGALALFGEKYGSTVRVVTIGDYSKELCGGTHLKHTGLVGDFVITGESSIASGTRRIEALVGKAGYEYQAQAARISHEAARQIGRSSQDLLEALGEMLKKLKEYERQVKTLREQHAKLQAESFVKEIELKKIDQLPVVEIQRQGISLKAKSIEDVTYVTFVMKNADKEALTNMADAMRLSIPGATYLFGASGDQGHLPVSIVMATTSDLVEQRKIHSGFLLKQVTQFIDGSGGGRAEFALGGGKDASGIPKAFQFAEDQLRKMLTSNRE